MAESTRSGSAAINDAIDAKARETWKAGYRAAMRDHLGETHTPEAALERIDAAHVAHDAHAADSTLYAA